MLAFIYIVICYIWALCIREKKNFEHLFGAFMCTLIVTPIFGRRLYHWQNEYIIDKAREEKEHKKRLDEDKKKIDEYKRRRLMEHESDNIKNWSKKKFSESRKK